MLTRRDAMLLPAVLAVSACQRPTLRVRMIGPADSAFISARGSGWFESLTRTVGIANVTVEATDGLNAIEKVWEVYREQTCNEMLRMVQYGILPTGFVEAVAPRALAEGATYVLTVGSCDYNQGLMYFVINDGRVRPNNPT